MAKVGYARISTIDQNHHLQLDALKAAGCDLIFKDSVSAVGAARPGFENALKKLRTGDALVVWKLDRAFRSTLDALTTWEHLQQRGIQLVIATLGVVSDTPEGRYFFRGIASAAEFERDMISIRTREGMAAAMRRGKHVGRPANTTEAELKEIWNELKSGRSIADLAAHYRMSEAVLLKRLKSQGLLTENGLPVLADS